MTVTPWIADVSFGHDATPGATLKAAGCVGVIAYAGCDDTRKNCTPGNVEDWLSHGLMLGLVIENGAQDLAGGQKVGAYQGQRLAAAAKTLGYDLSQHAGYAAADWNSQGAQLDEIDLAMEAFGDYVGVPGLYGNSYAIDRVIEAAHARYGWQSNSTSFSYGPSPHANLLQRWNDPRAAGLPVDASDIQHVPLGLMGETDMAFADGSNYASRADFESTMATLVHNQDLAVERAAEIAQRITADVVAGIKAEAADLTADAILALRQEFVPNAEVSDRIQALLAATPVLTADQVPALAQAIVTGLGPDLATQFATAVAAHVKLAPM